MSSPALQWFREAIEPVAARERDILTILALREGLRISAFADLLDSARVRQSPTRALSGVALRPILDELERRDLLTSDGQTWTSAPHARHPMLRLAAASGRLAALAPACVEDAFRRALPRASLWTALHAALARPVPETAALLDRCAAQDPELVAEVILAALTTPFDPDWFAAIPGPLRDRILAPALEHAETTGGGIGELYPALAAGLDALGGEPSVLVPLGGLALERGDTALARRIAEALGEAPAGRGILASIALIEGRHEEAAALFSVPAKHPAALPGLAGVLQVLALLGRAGSADLEAARRLTKVGMAKKNPYRLSHAALAQLVGSMIDPSRPLRARDFVLGGKDAMAPLIHLLAPLWFVVDDADARDVVMRALPRAEHFHALDQRWLADQHTHAIAAVVARHPSAGVHGKALPNGGGPPRWTPLAALRGVKEAWETALDGLSRLADAAPSIPREEGEEGEGAEQLFFRVFPRSGHIEPYLQRRKGKGWTDGRKLAVKHLLDPDLVSRLPTEDALVAAYAREVRAQVSGYPSIEHMIDRAAFTALVGHPRVFCEQQVTPIEVAAGQVHLVVRTEDAGLAVCLDPPDLRDEITLRLEAQRLLVYTLTEELQPVVKLVGRGLTIPSTARSRALDTLGRLARLLPVRSTEPTNARPVPADPRPWVRLSPSHGGLSVKIGVRPLGAEGPELSPGQGSTTLLARIHGEPVQTERDLAHEQRLLEEVIAACEVLVDGEDDRAFAVGDPTQCLMLVSALRGLGERVHVEWPHGKPLRLRASLGRRALRGRISFERGTFLASGSLVVDDELGLGLGELLSLVSERPGRFVRLAGGDYIELEQELREMLDALALVRRGSRAEEDAVVIPESAISVLERLTAEDGGISLDARSIEWRERFIEAFGKAHPVPRGLGAELRSYQVEGFVWLARLADLGLGACLADDMGLGKTVEIIALLLHRVKAQLGPALVVAPTSVCDNWAQEITRFAPSLGVRVFGGPGRARELVDLGSSDVVIVSYSLLQQDAARLQEIAWGTAVLDEAQLIKNPDSLRAKAAFGLQAAMRIAVTGTPVENHIGDLYSIFHFVRPDLLGSWGEFSRRFHATDESGASGRRAVKRLLQPFVLRRTKAQVLDDLPSLTEIQHTVTLSAAEAQLYEGVRRAALAKLGGALTNPGARVQVLAEITRLRRLCCHPSLVAPEAQMGSSKLAAFMDLMEELVEGHHRALVFSQFVDVLALAGQMLRERGISFQYLDGSTPARQRAEAARAFQSGEGDAFLISLKAGGVGLNLTAADYVIHLDPWWNPAVESQASDRAHRLGQTRPVTVYRLVTAGTIEARIVELHRVKRELADSLLEGTERSATMSADELRGLLEGP